MVHSKTKLFSLFHCWNNLFLLSLLTQGDIHFGPMSGVVKIKMCNSNFETEFLASITLFKFFMVFQNILMYCFMFVSPVLLSLFYLSHTLSSCFRIKVLPNAVMNYSISVWIFLTPKLPSQFSYTFRRTFSFHLTAKESSKPNVFKVTLKICFFLNFLWEKDGINISHKTEGLR